MTAYLSRDYVQSATGIIVQQGGTPYHSMNFYQIAVYLYRVLGWSIVGKSGIDLDTTNRSISISTIGAGIPFTITTGVPHGLPIGTSHGAQTTGASAGNGIWHVVSTGASTVEGRSYNGSSGSGGNLVTGPLHASGAVIDGYGAGINFGAGAFFEVSIPVAVRTVVAGDVGRMLVLKSTKFPTKNSGLFKISGINGGSNRYIIDYRATENPPVETDSIDWWLYEAENVIANQLFVDSFWWHSFGQNISAATNTTPVTVTAQNGNGSHNLFTGQRVTIANALGNTAINGSWTVTVLNATQFILDGSAGNGTYTSGGRFHKEGYPGNGLSGNPRIIFQSPHSTGYQVRLCLEPRGARLNPVSITTGFNGDGYGDFPVGNAQTHIAEYTNINPLVSQEYTGTVPGYGDVTIQYRNTFIGDTDGYYLFFWGRPTSGVRPHSITMIGVPENEPVPLAINEERVFVYGSAGSVTSGTSEQGGGVSPRIGINFGNVGLAMKKGAPKFAALTGWANLDGVNVTTPFFSSNAGDCPFIGATEVLPMEIWIGTYADVSLGTGAIPPFFFDQSYMGTSPLLRLGRANFASNTIALTNEEVTSRVINNATNTSPIQITTSLTNSLVDGQTVTISGVVGNDAANGTWTITRIDGTNFTLNGSTGNGAYISGGNVNGCASWIHLTNGTFMMWNGPSGIIA